MDYWVTIFLEVTLKGLQTPVPNLISYAELRSQINPGDIIVFSSKDLPSQIVKIATQSDYVYVAIVLSVEDDRVGEFLIIVFCS